LIVLLKALQACWLYCSCFLFFYDFGQTNYLKIYRADPRQIFKVVWLSTTNLKLVFRSPKGRFHGNQFLLFSIAGGQWRSRVG